MTGSTITITNLGDTGADLVHGVISPPQVALVGFGQLSPTALGVGEQRRRPTRRHQPRSPRTTAPPTARSAADSWPPSPMPRSPRLLETLGDRSDRYPRTRVDAVAMVLSAIADVAPELEPELADLDPTSTSGIELQLDSMDHLAIMTRLSEQTGHRDRRARLPEADHRQRAPRLPVAPQAPDPVIVVWLVGFVVGLAAAAFGSRRAVTAALAASKTSSISPGLDRADGHRRRHRSARDRQLDRGRAGGHGDLIVGDAAGSACTQVTLVLGLLCLGSTPIHADRNVVASASAR